MPVKGIVKAKKYFVHKGDSLELIAQKHGITWQQLTRFNWGTDDPDEINRYLFGTVGCREKTADKNNYIFTDNDILEGDGYIYVPEESPDKTYSTNTPHTIIVDPVIRKTYIPSKCIVKFRPQSDWEGEFGFDWMREGDSDLVGDEAYSTIASNYENLEDEYSPTYIPSWKKESDGKRYKYMVPWLSIFPEDQTRGEGNNKKCKAKLTLFYEIIDKDPVILRFVFDEEHFKLNKTEITPKDIGKYEKAGGMDLEVTCIKETTTLGKIEVWADIVNEEGKYETYLAGTIRILKNNKPNRYKANVVIVKVKTNINISKEGSLPISEIKTLEKHLLQPLSSLNYKEDTLDLCHFNPPGITVVDVFKNTYTMIHDHTNVIISNPTGAKQTLHQYLRKRFLEKYTKAGNKYPYPGYYLIFVFNEDGGILDEGSFYQAGGQSSGIPSKIKTVTLYNLHKDTAAPHELFHAFGLHHTWSEDSKNKHRFTKNKTENLMDYSDTRIATWKWQWDIIRKKLSKE